MHLRSSCTHIVHALTSNNAMYNRKRLIGWFVSNPFFVVNTCVFFFHFCSREMWTHRKWLEKKNMTSKICWIWNEKNLLEFMCDVCAIWHSNVSMCDHGHYHSFWLARKLPCEMRTCTVAPFYGHINGYWNGLEWTLNTY